MKKSVDEITHLLKQSKLRITPQRIAVLRAVQRLKNHPTAELILESIRLTQPNIAMGTVYNALEALAKHKLIRKVKTETGSTRYDGILEHHHHLYCSLCGKILDYSDPEVDKILTAYFKSKGVPDFKLASIQLQLHGHCTTKGS